jgi:lysyl-tRNA synthetase class 2
MSSFDEIRKERIAKLNVLKEKGINPYPISASPSMSLAKVIENFEKLSSDSSEGKEFFLCGRIMSLRPQGGIAFLTLDDGTAKFQGFLKKGDMPDEAFDLFMNTTDVGDFVELKGTFFVTARGEKSLNAKSWRMLSKSLRPLPEKRSGLQDPDLRFRNRYLDTLQNAEVKERFILRSKIISEIRSFLNNHDFLEVETPMLVPQATGASAEPFVTHHNALDMDLYLRIAPELYLKRLMIGGFPKVYELNKNFRNEGIDMTHNPEFTMLEFYESYGNKDSVMKLTEDLIRSLVTKIFNASSLVCEENTISFSEKFNIQTYSDILEKHAGISAPEKITHAEAVAVAGKLKIKINPNDPVQKIVDYIYKKACRPHIIQPTFIIDYPADYLPLAKRKEDNQAVVDVFQLVIGGVEVVKAFSELNDPIDQAERFAAQDSQKEQGDAEAQSTDTDYIEALEYGMPPAGGVGIGIDRLVMLLTNTQNIKEVILFPTMRHKE